MAMIPTVAVQGERQQPNAQEVALDCGWGRLLFAQTFPDIESLTDSLMLERKGERDVAFYLSEPHVALSHAPQKLFLDPSHSFRLALGPERKRREPVAGLRVEELSGLEQVDEVNRIYAKAGMVRVLPEFFEEAKGDDRLIHLVALDENSGAVIGTVTGVDHVEVFGDPEQGCSLWCLAVDPQATLPGIGEALVRRLARLFEERGRKHLDLSVMHDNSQAIALYEKLGFVRLPVFTLKTKNSINERLYIAPPPEAQELNPYAKIIVDEARRRGIDVDILDAAGGFFRLSHGGRSVVCRESLSELTTAVAMSRCDDKAVTQRLLANSGLRVPRQKLAGTPEENAEFLSEQGSLVVKPLRGEQGRGISIDLRTFDEVDAAIERARAFCEDVLLEQYVEGEDLRVIVIGGSVVAAALRRPPEIQGDGVHSIAELIDKQSRRRAAATGGESRIPLDAETRRAIRNAGYELDSVPPEGERLQVRKTANLHTGGTIHDVTDQLSSTISSAAVEAARALEIPVVGLDFLVPEVEGSDFVIIEANERPGLANHEPAPTAERFVDLLFPHTNRELTR
ncbi:N-acetylglutaminylglutamine synthetase [Limibacillus halophilus]